MSSIAEGLPTVYLLSNCEDSVMRWLLSLVPSEVRYVQSCSSSDGWKAVKNLFN